MALLTCTVLAACNMLTTSEQQATSAPTSSPTLEVSPVMPAVTLLPDTTSDAILDNGTPSAPDGDTTAQAMAPTETPEFMPTTPTPMCSGAPVQKLIVQERGMVTENGQELNIRPDAGISDDNEPLGKLMPGDIFLVLEGPVCANRYAWFRVRSSRFEGWIAEGDTQEYYVAPYLPG